MISVEARYGQVQALMGISLEVPKGEVVAVLGANGAGKTTALRAISGLVPPSKGRVEFEGKRIEKLPPDKIVRLGIAHVPEGREIFPELTVMENLRMGAYARRDKGRFRRNLERVWEHFPVLRERGSQLAGTLSGGEQQMLAIGRGLMSEPSLILLDEPSLGLAPLLVKEILSIIKRINDEGTTVLLVEQNVQRALTVADYAYVLETGRLTLEGKGEALLRNEHVRKSYLGE